jgi:hypothetical protein
MLARLFFVLLAVVPAISSTMSAEVTIGSISIILPPPAGFCELTVDEHLDNRAITDVTEALAKFGIKLLAMSADCRQLTEWRAGKRPLLDDFAQYHIPVRMMTGESLPATTAESINKICAGLRAHGERIVSNQMSDFKSVGERIFKEIGLNEIKFIGVVAEDPSVCYTAYLQKLRTVVGTDKTQLHMSATTGVKTKQIGLSRYAVYHSSNTLDGALAQAKRDIAALFAANEH